LKRSYLLGKEDMRTFQLGALTAKLVLPSWCREALEKRCFRGVDIAAAGNFNRWSNFIDMIYDRRFTDPLMEIVQDIIEEREADLDQGFTEAFTVPFIEPVGWTSILPVDLLSIEDLRQMETEARWSALFVVNESVLAPQTSLVSMTLKICRDNLGHADFACLVKDLRPGPLPNARFRGDMTEKTGYAWFNLRHPGGQDLVELEL